MATLDGDTRADRHLRYYAKRSVQVFRIFDQVFGATAARQRIVRVMAVQQGTGDVELSTAKAMAPSSKPIEVDALATAPYFGPR